MPSADDFWPPIFMDHVHGSLPGQEPAYAYCLCADSEAIRDQFVAAVEADFAPPADVTWGIYPDDLDDATFQAGPITPENIDTIHSRLTEIIVSVSLPHTPERDRGRLREAVQASFDRIGPNNQGCR